MAYNMTDIRRLKFNIDSTLVVDMLNALPKSVFTSKTTTFFDPEMAGGQYVSAIISRLRAAGHSDKNIASRVYGNAATQMTLNYATNKNKLIGQFVVNGEFDMKFDVIVGNPPYQTETAGNSRPIWDKFTVSAFDHLNDNGYLVLVHPAGWRNVGGRYEYIRDLLYSKQMEYLEIHNYNDGRKTFGVSTRYDWYCLKNAPSKKGDGVLVKFEDGTTKKIDVTKLPFIPNHSYDKIAKLIAKPGDESVEVLHSYSAYETRAAHISKTKTKKFKYPVIYFVSAETGLPVVKYYSSINTNGHFGVPKLIWSNSGTTETHKFYLDETGKYGLTEFAYAIVDSPNNLKKIQKAVNLPSFRTAMLAAEVGTRSINRRVLACLKKDFYKYV